MVEAWCWSEVSADEDPFEDRPAIVNCANDAWSVEELGGEWSLGIDTSNCDYLTISQPNLTEVLEGDSLSMRLWHFELIHDESAEAHAAISTKNEILWEEWIAIPSQSGMSAPEWLAPSDIPRGTEIFFHLHNHGSNAWNLMDVVGTPTQ